MAGVGDRSGCPERVAGMAVGFCMSNEFCEEIATMSF